MIGLLKWLLGGSLPWFDGRGAGDYLSKHVYQSVSERNMQWLSISGTSQPRIVDEEGGPLSITFASGWERIVTITLTNNSNGLRGVRKTSCCTLGSVSVTQKSAYRLETLAHLLRLFRRMIQEQLGFECGPFTAPSRERMCSKRLQAPRLQV